jgi:lipoyl(octanoyl) transferase
MQSPATHLRELVGYEEAAAAQRRLVELRRGGALPDLLWLLEHPPTITWGSSGGEHHLLRGEAELRARGVVLAASERGGDVTYHGPGQLVGYPIVDLRDAGRRDLHDHLRRLEAGLIACLRRLGLDAAAVAGRTGVWIPGPPPRKIAAIGVRAKGWISSHGFALNVDGSLEGFRWIVPCGIQDAGVTSVKQELGERPLPAWPALRRAVHEEMERALGGRLVMLVGREGLKRAGA